MAQPPIQLLAERIIGAKGPDYFMAIQTLRMYMKGLSDAAFEAQVREADNPDIFSVLWSAGLSWVRQGVVSEKWEELEK